MTTISQLEQIKEECAKIADKFAFMGVMRSMECTYKSEAGKSIAADIRALPLPVMPSKNSRDQLYLAAINCAHEITDKKIILHRDASKEGNALSQLADRLESALPVMPEQAKPVLSMSMFATREQFQKASKIAELESEAAETKAVIDKMSHVLADISITLNGEEIDVFKHSYHDLGEQVTVLKLENELNKVKIAELEAENAKLRGNS